MKDKIINTNSTKVFNLEKEIKSTDTMGRELLFEIYL